jgi:hypothetical protein
VTAESAVAKAKGQGRQEGNGHPASQARLRQGARRREEDLVKETVSAKGKRGPGTCGCGWWGRAGSGSPRRAHGACRLTSPGRRLITGFRWALLVSVPVASE